MAATSMETCLKSVRSLPDDLRGRVALVDETLYISEEQKGKIEIINLATTASRLGIGGIVFVPPARFDAQYVRYAARTGLGDNEIQQMAIDLIARAHAQGASDIHVADMGTFCKIRFRVLGMLTDDSELDGFTGRQLIRVIYDHLGASQDTSAFNNKFSLDARIADRNVLPHGVHSVRIHSEPTECIHGEDGFGTFMALRLIHDTSGASGTLEERLERIALYKREIIIGEGLAAQYRRKTMVDLERRHRSACLQQQMGYGTESGAYFPDLHPLLQLYRLHYTLPGIFGEQEVLAELLRHRKAIVLKDLLDRGYAAVIQ